MVSNVRETRAETEVGISVGHGLFFFFAISKFKYV